MGLSSCSEQKNVDTWSVMRLSLSTYHKLYTLLTSCFKIIELKTFLGTYFNHRLCSSQLEGLISAAE